MSIINDFKNEFRFSAHGRTSRRNFWIYQIGLFVLGLAVAMVCGTIIGLTNAVVGFWLIIAALLILPPRLVAARLKKHESRSPTRGCGFHSFFR